MVPKCPQSLTKVWNILGSCRQHPTCAKCESSHQTVPTNVPTMALSLQHLNRLTSASFDRRRWLKSTAFLTALAPFNRILPSAFNTGISSKNKVNSSEEELTMNSTKPIASSWLEPQVGFQLAHEQFKVPELVELGIAADQAGFDLLAVSDHFQPWQENEGHSGQA